MEDKRQNIGPGAETPEVNAVEEGKPAPDAGAIAQGADGTDDVIRESGLSEEEIQNQILEDSDMTGFQKFLAKLDDKTWTLYQRIAGVVLGLLAGVALFWRAGGEKASSYGFIIAIAIAMLVPNIMEKKGLRRMNRMRTAMVITLGLIIVGYIAYLGITTGFHFKVTTK